MPAMGGPGKGHVTPPTEADRVLGQIARGEVRAGPEAAREIAARHEAAYGDAFGTSRDEQGQQALDGLAPGAGD